MSGKGLRDESCRRKETECALRPETEPRTTLNDLQSRPRKPCNYYYEARCKKGARLISTDLFLGDEVNFEGRVLINVREERQVWNADAKVWVVNFRLCRPSDLIFGRE